MIVFFKKKRVVKFNTDNGVLRTPIDRELRERELFDRFPNRSNKQNGSMAAVGTETCGDCNARVFSCTKCLP